VGRAVELLNVATRPSFIAGWPDKWTSCAQSSARALPYSYKYPGAPLAESVKEVRFSPP
jgi:hypothetical protein